MSKKYKAGVIGCTRRYTNRQFARCFDDVRVFVVGQRCALARVRAKETNDGATRAACRERRGAWWQRGAGARR